MQLNNNFFGRASALKKKLIFHCLPLISLLYYSYLAQGDFVFISIFIFSCICISFFVNHRNSFSNYSVVVTDNSAEYFFLTSYFVATTYEIVYCLFHKELNSSLLVFFALVYIYFIKIDFFKFLSILQALLKLIILIAIIYSVVRFPDSISVAAHPLGFPEHRAKAFFSSPQIFSLQSALLILITFFNSRFISFNNILVAILIGLLGLYLSFTRTSILAILCALPFIYIFNALPCSKYDPKIFRLFIYTCATLALWLAMDVLIKKINFSDSIKLNSAQNSFAYIVTSGRTMFYDGSAAINSLKTHYHNIWLDIYRGWYNIPFALVYFSFLIQMAMSAVRKDPAISFFIFIFAGSLIDLFWQMNRASFISIFLIIMVASSLPRNDLKIFFQNK